MIKRIAFLTLIATALSHSMMKVPGNRGKECYKEDKSDCGGSCGSHEGCGPCERSKDKFKWPESQYHEKPWYPKTFHRGQEITVGWDRFNHPGGFVCLSVIPFDESDNWSSIENNIVKCSCYERGCGPKCTEPQCADEPSTAWVGHLNGGGEGPCDTKLTIPSHLPNGRYTLHWTWFGGGIVDAEANTGFGEFYNCYDFEISGSEPIGEKASPVWQGGDYSGPDKDDCKYWTSNQYGFCRHNSNEVCARGPASRGKPSLFSSS